ncbi:MAG TPA: ECF-type sigma factor [Bryobacteraceae bacterium]|nr:ECF-type sigma factor [Bryobacteraceae bacterium]
MRSLTNDFPDGTLPPIADSGEACGQRKLGAEGHSPGDVTVLLSRIGAGERDAESRLFDLVYQELYAIARRQARAERPGHTLGATAIVHEAYLRLFGGNLPVWKDRTHFYSTATRVMRNLLVDYARRRKAARHDGGIQAELHDHFAGWDGRDMDRVLLVDQALSRLAQRDARQAKIFEMRFLAGLQVVELAQAFGLHRRTILRELRSAEAWIKTQVGNQAIPGYPDEEAGVKQNIEAEEEE